jgi:hypothetical protein
MMNSPQPGRTAKDDRGDPKVIATVKTINVMKASNAIMPEFLKAVQKYHQQLHALNQTSQVLLPDRSCNPPPGRSGG